jgi:hypothetical protein
VASVLGTRLAVRVGNKVIVAAGLMSFAIGLLWSSTASVSTSYTIIVAQMLLLGTGMGLTSAPATEAIMGAVPEAKAGVGSAINDATRLFGGTLGVAVIGSVAASLYASRLASTTPAHLPAQAISAAKSSVGGAIIASHVLAGAGLGHAARALTDAANGAFLHSLAGGTVLTAGVAIVGALMAAILLPARPRPTREANEARPDENLEGLAAPAPRPARVEVSAATRPVPVGTMTHLQSTREGAPATSHR